MSAQLAAAIISATFSVILTAIVSYFGYRARGILSEVERNSSFRRLMVGEEAFERDSGELERMDAQFDRMRKERHREFEGIREQLSEIEEGMAYITEFVRNIAGAINRSDIDESISEPSDLDRPGTWRGGEESSDD